MSYKSIYELPDQIRYNLPNVAQKVFLEAYNSAWERYEKLQKKYGIKSREEVAVRAAWSAVKKQYDYNPLSGDWKEKELV